jgi:acyl transferase domain-containing protein
MSALNVIKNGEPAPLYVTAVNDEQCITISGRPDILDSFVATLPEVISVRETSVGTMYHSPSHNSRVREEVLEDLWRRKIRFPTFSDIICPIRSTFTGETLEASQKGSLVQLIVDMILVQPVNWVKVTNAIARSIPENETAHIVNVGPGTGLVRSMEKALRCGGSMTHQLIFDDAKKDAISEPGQDCIAVVGMAVKLPGAPTTSKLWDILRQGINTLAEVRRTLFLWM